MADTLQKTVHTKVPKTSDLEIHVSTVEAPGGDVYGEIREYVVSLGQYGRGITFPATQEILESITLGLGSIVIPVVPS